VTAPHNNDATAIIPRLDDTGVINIPADQTTVMRLVDARMAYAPASHRRKPRIPGWFIAIFILAITAATVYFTVHYYHAFMNSGFPLLPGHHSATTTSTTHR
jgi:hypothetical protein